jgi:UDP-glucose 4-epimerase
VFEPYRRTAVIGGAGFIGSHFVHRLLADPSAEQVVVYDNFTSGQMWHLEPFTNDPRLQVVEGDVKNVDDLTSAITGMHTVIHLASNPDIAKAMTDPTIDFVEGTLLTNNVVEACRRASIDVLLYASGSGIYGDLGNYEPTEDHGPLRPTSTYGASKLAGEAMLSAYSSMFGFRSYAYRFGNVVGPRQTHGVGFDFVRRLLNDPTELRILGDGLQSKSYVHVDDVVSAVLLAPTVTPDLHNAFNVATGDYITVTEIAEIAIEVLSLDPSTVRLDYTGGDRGWKGDVPVVRLNTDKIRSLGWSNRRSTREALRASLESMLAECVQSQP